MKKSTSAESGAVATIICLLALGCAVFLGIEIGESKNIVCGGRELLEQAQKRQYNYDLLLFENKISKRQHEILLMDLRALHRFGCLNGAFMEEE